MNFREKEKEVLDDILGPGRYDARIRPSGENGTGEYMNVLFFTSIIPSSLPYQKKKREKSTNYTNIVIKKSDTIKKTMKPKSLA